MALSAAARSLRPMPRPAAAGSTKSRYISQSAGWTAVKPMTRSPSSVATSIRFGGAWSATSLSHSAAVNIGWLANSPRYVQPTRTAASKTAPIAWASLATAGRRRIPGSSASAILKAPAGRAMWLDAGHTEGGRWGHDVKVPGRGPSTGCAVLGGEGTILHTRRPPLGVIAFHQALERRLVGDHARGPLDDQVDPSEDHRDDALRILRQVPALARPRTAHEVKLTVVPQRTHPRDVRPLVGPTGGQPVRVWCAGLPRFRRGRLERCERARPGNRFVAVDVEILLFHLSPPFAT